MTKGTSQVVAIKLSFGIGERQGRYISSIRVKGQRVALAGVVFTWTLSLSLSRRVTAS